MKISASQFHWIIDAYFYPGARIFHIGPVIVAWRKPVPDPPGWEPRAAAPDVTKKEQK